MIWNLPNILSLSRLAVFLPVLWLLACYQQPQWLGAVLIAALATDACDGFLARRLNQVTALGARLDSIADNSLIVSAIVWLLWLRPEVIQNRYGVLLTTAVALWALTVAIGWIRFHRFANLHLYSDKIAAVIGGVFLVVSFLNGFIAWLFYLATGTAILASLEGAVLLLTRNRVNEHMGSIFRPVERRRIRRLIRKSRLPHKSICPTRFANIAVVVLFGLTLSGCAIKAVVVDKVGDALSESGNAYASDPDIELVGAASPFGLKLIESLLEEAPRHRNLLLAAARGYTQYAFAYVQVPADDLELSDINAAYAQRSRARRLYLRARDYGLRGLGVTTPRIAVDIRQDPTKALQKTKRDDVPLMYWAAAAWGAAIGLGKDDPGLLADIPVVEALIRRVLELDDAFQAGAAHSMMISLVMAKPGPESTRTSAADTHFDRAVELSRGLAAAPYVAYAEAVAIPRNDKKTFDAKLQQALQIEKMAAPQWRLVNEVYQRRARWLLTNSELYFPQ